MVMPDTLTATFLFTDIVGSTRLRVRLGDDVADAIGARHDTIVDAALEHQGGQLVKRLGDGAMAMFTSASDAVGAAVEVQNTIAEGNRDTEPEAHLSVRVGINAGEVMADDGDFHGIPVTVASRVCDHADGGQVVITAIVRTLVGSRGGHTFGPLGPTTLKGLEQPVDLWEVATSAAVVTSDAEDTEFSFPPVLARAAASTLVGRAGAARRIEDVFERSETGELWVAFVVGEPGVGKTAFASSWCRTAFDRGAVVLAGRSPMEAITPYQPFVEIVRQVVLNRPALLQHLGSRISTLVRLVPDLAHRIPASPKVTVDPSTERYLLFESVATLLRGVAAEQPVVLFLDDLHWADAPSLAMLDHLVRHPEAATMLVVGTYRDTDLSRSHPLSRLLADLRRDRRTERILLRGLDEEGVGGLIESRLGRPAPAVVVQSVYEETEGNPFFVEEMIAHLQESGTVNASGEWISSGSLQDIGIPEGIRDVVGARLDRLAPQTNRVLSVAAAIGREFDFNLLQAVTEQEVEEVETSLGEALASGLLVEAGPGQYEFSHALIRQTLLEEMPGPRAGRMHRSVAEALAAAGAPPGELAHHWAEAFEFEKALPALVAAATAAEAVFAFDDARHHLELALELWDDVEEAEECAGTSHLDLLRRLAEMRHVLGDGRGAALLAEDALTEVDAEHDPVLAGAILERLARYRWVQGEGVAALEAGTAAVEMIPPEPPTVERAKALAALASLFMLSSRFIASLEYADLAIEAARLAGARAVEGHALTTRGTVVAMLDDVDGGIDFIEQGRALSREEGAIDDLLRTFANAGSCLHRAGRYPEALEQAQSAIDLAAELGLASWMMAMRGNAAEALFDMGRWAESSALLEQELPATGASVSVYMESGVLARLAIGRGEFTEAARQLDRSAMLEDRAVDPQFIGPYFSITADLARWLGRRDEALEKVRIGLERLAGSEDLFYFDPLREMGIALVGDVAEAGEASPELVAEAQAWWQAMVDEEADHGEARARRASAFAELGRAEGGDDPDLWQEAVSAWDDLGRPYEAAYARWRLVAATGEDARSGRAEDALREAAEIAREIGAAPLLAALEATSADLP